MNETNPFKLLGSKIVYQNHWMKVREDSVIRPDGSKGIYGVMESRDSVMIVVLNEAREVYILQTFSYPASAWNWELPGGGTEDEAAEQAARRELVEEAGMTAQSWTQLGNTRVCNGLMSERKTTFLAQDLSFGEKVDSGDKELIREGKFVSFAEIGDMVKRGEIDDGQSLTALYLAQQWLATQQ